jgi:hypothetical protein
MHREASGAANTARIRPSAPQPPCFIPWRPESSDLQQLVAHIAARIGHALEGRGLVERDLENAWLSADTEAGPLDDLLGHSITYRIAVGPRAGQKLFALQTVPPRPQGPEGEPNGAARAGGFSLHAGVDIAPDERAKLERLCRYVSRPPVASERLALTASGQVRYTLKTPYRAGTTHIVLEPLDLMARLAALVPTPRPRICLTNGRGRQLPATCNFAVHQSTQFAQIFDRTSSRSVVDGTQ